MPMLASPASAGLAWSLIKARLINWGAGESARYDARLILFELVANAVAVTPPAGMITVACIRDRYGVVIEVSDSCPDVPKNPAPIVELQPGDLDLNEENWDNNGGWGLTLIKAVCAGCGVRALPSGAPGKTVWARLRLS